MVMVMVIPLAVFQHVASLPMHARDTIGINMTSDGPGNADFKFVVSRFVKSSVRVA